MLCFHKYSWAAVLLSAVMGLIVRGEAFAQTRYRVLVAYTPAVRAAVGNIRTFIQLAVDESNESYANSDVNAQVVLARSVEFNYVETGNWVTDRDWFFNNAMVGTLRDLYRADVCVGIINNAAWCGEAQGILVDETQARVVVHWQCATGYYSFIHEIGHLFGCRHDVLRDPTNQPYAWQHGYRGPNEDWRTIMAYDCIDGDGCPRLQYWSNPNVLNPQTNEPMGTAANEDNHRVNNDRVGAIANFRTTLETQTIANDVVDDNQFAHAGATITLNIGDGFTVAANGQATLEVGPSALAKHAHTAAGGDGGMRMAALPSADALLSIVPAARGLRVRYSVERPVAVRVEIYTLSGTRVAHMDWSCREAGLHEALVELPRLPNTGLVARLRLGHTQRTILYIPSVTGP